MEPTGEKAPNGDLIYEKTTPSDHMAMEVEIKVNIELPYLTTTKKMVGYNTKKIQTK